MSVGKFHNFVAAVAVLFFVVFVLCLGQGTYACSIAAIAECVICLYHVHIWACVQVCQLSLAYNKHRIVGMTYYMLLL